MEWLLSIPIFKYWQKFIQCVGVKLTFLLYLMWEMLERYGISKNALFFLLWCHINIWNFPNRKNTSFEDIKFKLPSEKIMPHYVSFLLCTCMFICDHPKQRGCKVSTNFWNKISFNLLKTKESKDSDNWVSNHQWICETFTQSREQVTFGVKWVFGIFVRNTFWLKFDTKIKFIPLLHFWDMTISDFSGNVVLRNQLLMFPIPTVLLQKMQIFFFFFF